MKLIILVAAQSSRLENEIKSDKSGEFSRLVSVPKALLPCREGLLLDNWLQTRSCVAFSEIFLVTNAEKYKFYERWATAHGLPKDCVVNDGTTTASGQLGAVADLLLVIRRCNVQEDVMVVAGDMLFNPRSFDAGTVVRFFEHVKGDVACYYHARGEEERAGRGLMELDPATQRVTGFFEKPAADKTTSANASIVFCCLRAASLPLVSEFLTTQSEPSSSLRFGHFLAWLATRGSLYGMKLPEPFDLIGDVGLAEYRALLNQHVPVPLQAAPGFSKRVNARVGLVGNPSDGFHGHVLSLSIQNYSAEVTIRESEHVVLTRNPLLDPTEFGSLADLHGISVHEGYQGGLRLMQATCKRFFDYCCSHGIALARRNFTLSYDTNIPRQVGLAGSSAIVTATLECLKAFYSLTSDDLPKHEQPNLALSVETDELGIAAGLQDRVIQTYGGLMSMSFAEDLMVGRGYGEYVRMDHTKLPPLWLAYCAHPKDSGKMHNNVRQRWLAGDAEAVTAMKSFAALAVRAREAIEREDFGALADTMDENFSLRRKLYTDKCLGTANLEMASIAHKYNSAAKLPGSGGAVLGLCRDQKKFPELQREMEQKGYVCILLLPAPPVE